MQHEVYLLIGVNNPGCQCQVWRIYYACTVTTLLVGNNFKELYFSDRYDKYLYYS